MCSSTFATNNGLKGIINEVYIVYGKLDLNFWIWEVNYAVTKISLLIVSMCASICFYSPQRIWGGQILE